MVGWILDEKRFREEVYQAIAAHWQPSDDLFRCYQLPLDVSSPQVIAAALKGVQQHVNAAGKRDAGGARMLRHLHPAATAVLTDPQARARHQDEVLARRQQLRAFVAAEIAGWQDIPSAAVVKIAQHVTPRFVTRDVEAVLDELGVRRREPAQLPPRRRWPGGWADVRGSLAMLERRGARGSGATYSSLRDYLLDTFGTVQVDKARVADRQKTMRTERRGEVATIEARVLSALTTWLGTGSLGGLLTTELLEQLLSAARFGRDAVRTEAQRADVRAALGDLGLPAGNDLVYAVLCESRYPARDSADAWKAAYHAAQDASDLRGALAVLDARPDLPPEFAARRDELRRRLTTLGEELAHARRMETDDPEAAAETYLRVRRELDDPEVAAGLARCRPAPPPRATATVEGDRVVISWSSSPARVGDVAYRVVRGDCGRPVGGGGTVVGDLITTNLETVDVSAPAGIALHYAVVTIRDGVSSATGAHASPVIVARDVEELIVTGGQGLVEGSWQLPRGACGARVERVEVGTGGDSGKGVTVPAPAGDRFRDTSVRQGVLYEYRVQAEYQVPGGTTHLSRGVSRRGRSQQRPVAVTDLACQTTGDTVVLSWTPPPNGQVEVRLLDAKPGGAAGRLVPVDALRHLGTPLRNASAIGVSGLRAHVPNDGRTHWFIPVTVVDELGAVGASVELNRSLPPVDGLRARRLGSTVQLTWQWPADIGEVEVTCVPARGAEAQRTVLTRASYAHRGCRVTVGGGAHLFTVSPVAHVDGVRLLGPGRTAHVTVPVEVQYELRRTGWRRAPSVLIDAAGELDPQTFRLVAKAGVPPQDDSDGTACQVRWDEAAPDGPLTGEVVVPPGRRPLFVRVFAVGEGSDAMVLVPRRPEQLRIT